MADHKRHRRWAFWRRSSATVSYRCREIVEVVTVYLEGGMGPEDLERFERHIGNCPNCAAYLEQMRATLAVAGRIDPDALSPEVESELLAAFREWQRP